MAINVRDSLYQKGDEFRGAVFLTYSLNLNFFEQLIMPKLSMAGCAHIVVLADVFGYDEALAQGSRSLSSVGTRYVCSPLVNPGVGVQHAKLILLAGPHQGRLLVGSGNLTLPGYGRNLELFNCFDVRAEGNVISAPEIGYPFITSWQLLKQLGQNNELSSAATEQFDAIQEMAPWLNVTTVHPAEIHLWHSLVQSIYSRLAELDPVRELQIIAPFQDLDTIQALVRHFQPQRLIVGVDSTTPNLDGRALAARSASWGCSLELRMLSGHEGHRTLHAKAIIGIGDRGAWCVTGSANCTPPAMLRSWRNGGNLELVMWQSSPDPAAFEPLWQDKLITVIVQNPALVEAGDHPIVDEPDELAPSHVRLLELSCQDHTIVGHLDHANAETEPGTWKLELLRRRQSMSIHLDKAGRFSVSLETPLAGAEAGRVVAILDDVVVLASPYHWIDQPAELAKFGRRSYYARVRESLSTFDGAGKLFEELMNYLWERVDPQAVHDQEEDPTGSGRRRRRSRPEADTDPMEEAPPPESFITEEQLVDTLGNWVENGLPFDRSTMSLRDLLSLALLRLTTETAPPTPDVGEDRERNEEADAQRTAELERQQRTALEQLRTYLLGYCSRYGRRMTDPAFVAGIGPKLLFENNYTLGRVLLEVFDKVEVFSRQDLRRTAFQMLGGMFWPKGIRLSGDGAWAELVEAGHSPTELREQWDALNLTPLAMALFFEGWKDPVPWEQGLIDEWQTQHFLRSQALVHHMEQALGKRFWEPWGQYQVDQWRLQGFRTIADLDYLGSTTYPLLEAGKRCANLASYVTPVLEKYRVLWQWWQFVLKGQERSQEAIPLLRQVQRRGYSRELDVLRQVSDFSHVKYIDGSGCDCPGCYTALPKQVESSIRNGQLLLCPNCRHTILYWKPSLNLEMDTL